MRPSRNPHAVLRPRWSAALAVWAILLAVTGSAQAATGGAGVATAPVGEDIAFTPFRSAGASWYGPGLWGNKTACGQTLRPNTLGVAHRNLPCGTTVKFVFRGRALITQVIDRGPYVKDRAWDLTAAASQALEFDGVGMVRYAVAVDYARAGTRR